MDCYGADIGVWGFGVAEFYFLDTISEHGDEFFGDIFVDVQASDTVIGLPIIIESIFTYLIGRKLKISTLVHISSLIRSIEKITVNKTIFYHDLENPTSTTSGS